MKSWRVAMGEATQSTVSNAITTSQKEPQDQKSACAC